HRAKIARWDHGRDDKVCPGYSKSGFVLAGASSVFAALAFVFLEVLFLAFVELFGFIAGALGGVEGGFAGKILCAVARGLIQNLGPFRGGWDKVFQGFADVGVSLIEGVEVVLQLIGDAGELLIFGAQIGLTVFTGGIRTDGFDGVDAFLEKLLVELDAVVGTVAEVGNFIGLLAGERVLLSLGVQENCQERGDEKNCQNLAGESSHGPAFLFCLDFDANAGREGMSWERGKRKGESVLLFALAADDGGSGFAVGFAAALGFALVPVLLAFRYCQFALDAAMAEVEAGGDERMSFDLRL